MRKRRVVVELPAGRLPPPVRRTYKSPRAISIRAPVFSRLCVCCGTDTYNRNQPVHLHGTELVVGPIDVPVCGFCHEHAVGTPRSMIWLGLSVVFGVILVALGLADLTGRPGGVAWTLAAGGLTVLGVAAVWGRWELRHRRDLTQSGHNPGLVIDGSQKRTLVSTTSDRLIDELLALNPDARRRVDRRLGRGAIPQARLVRGGGDDDGERELTDAEKQRMLDEILGPRRPE